MINEWLKEYSQLKEQEKELKAKLAAASGEIKSYLEKEEKEEYCYDGIKITYKPTEKVSMNEEKLILTLKKLARTTKDLELRKVIKSSIKKVEAVDENVLEELIYNGTIDSSQLEECYESKISYTLRLTQPKNKK